MVSEWPGRNPQHPPSPSLPIMYIMSSTRYGCAPVSSPGCRRFAHSSDVRGRPRVMPHIHGFATLLHSGTFYADPWRHEDCLGAEHVQRLVGSLKTDLGRPPHESLSNREFQVLRMLAAGTTVKSIAHELVPGLRDALATEAIFPHDAGRLRGAAHDAVQGRRRGRHRHRPRREPLHRRLRASRRQARVRGQRLLRFRTTLFVGARPGQAPGPVNLVARRSLTPAAASR